MRIWPSMTFMIFIRRPGWMKTTLKIGNGNCDTSNKSSNIQYYPSSLYQQRTEVNTKGRPLWWKSCSKTDHSTGTFYPPYQGTLLKISLLFCCSSVLYQPLILVTCWGQVQTTCRTSKPFTMRLQHMFLSLFQTFWDTILQLQTMYLHNSLSLGHTIFYISAVPTFPS